MSQRYSDNVFTYYFLFRFSHPGIVVWLAPCFSSFYCGPSDNFCYNLGHTKNPGDDDDEWLNADSQCEAAEPVGFHFQMLGPQTEKARFQNWAWVRHTRAVN